MDYSRDRILECLYRQLPENFMKFPCGSGCPYALPGSGMCEYIGESEQYEIYMSLLRDPAVPADRAAPLLSVLEHCSNMDNEYCDDSCPYFSSCGGQANGDLLQDVYNLCKECCLYDSFSLC